MDEQNTPIEQNPQPEKEILKSNVVEVVNFSTKFTLSLSVVLVVILLVVVGGWYYLTKFSRTDTLTCVCSGGSTIETENDSCEFVCPVVQKEEENELITEIEEVAENLLGYKKYKLQSLGVNCVFPDSETDKYCDVSLIGIDNSDNKDILVRNFTSLFNNGPYSLTKDFPIQEMYFPENAEKLILKVITFSESRHWYSFNLKTGEFKRTGKSVGASYTTLSPNQSRAAFLSDDGNQLLLTDILSDTRKVISILSGDETFINRYSAFDGQPLGSIKWLDENTVEYEVYDKNDNNSEIMFYKRTPIDTREVLISD
jgi:hypothetical protein